MTQCSQRVFPIKTVKKMGYGGKEGPTPLIELIFTVGKDPQRKLLYTPTNAGLNNVEINRRQ